MGTTLSPYLLIFRNTSTQSYQALSPEQRQDLMQQWNDWYDRLAHDGKVQQGHPLELAGRVVTHSGVVDGPFAEAKEAIGGYFFVTVSSLDEATEIAQQCPSLRHGIIVEVRPVGQTCPALGRNASKGDRSPEIEESGEHKSPLKMNTNLGSVVHD